MQLCFHFHQLLRKMSSALLCSPSSPGLIINNTASAKLQFSVSPLPQELVNSGSHIWARASLYLVFCYQSAAECLNWLLVVPLKTLFCVSTKCSSLDENASSIGSKDESIATIQPLSIKTDQICQRWPSTALSTQTLLSENQLKLNVDGSSSLYQYGCILTLLSSSECSATI